MKKTGLILIAVSFIYLLSSCHRKPGYEIPRWYTYNESDQLFEAVEHENSPDIYYCMPGITANQSLLKGHEPGHLDCQFNVYNNPNNIEDYSIQNISAYCGFNKRDEAYCPAGKGDSMFMN